MANVLFSLQTKLIVAFALVTIVGLAIGGVVFVAAQRDEEEEQALEHVIATSPAVYSEFTFLQRRGDPLEELAAFIDAAADDHELRILLVDRGDGTIAADSSDELTDETLDVPQPVRGAVDQPVRGQPYVSWRGDDGPARGLTFMTALPSRLAQAPPRGAEQYWLVLAVPDSTIRDAWRDLLPALFFAALIALPIAVVLAMVVSAYVTRPIHQLTIASQRMAGGDFDVQVNVDRRDEVGRLARTFSTMARRVGETHTQMRQLVANVSHDLKTPLTSILGFAQALRDGRSEDGADAQRMGAVIYDEASRLTQRQRNDLLYLSEIESGQALLERADVDVARLMRRAVERIEGDLAARNVRLDVDLAGGVTVAADGPKLERAVENLLDNARKYTPDAGEVRVRAFVEAAPAAVVIEVANTAADVSEEELPRLFERFYRRDRVRGQGNGADGTGLGLAIARDLVELHGGTLAASLREGLLVLTVRLPLRT